MSTGALGAVLKGVPQTGSCWRFWLLQDGVPDCLQALAAAGIKVWVLTGDKVETAISIAFSCRLFVDGMGLVEFREPDFQKADTVEAKKRVSSMCRLKAGAGAATWAGQLPFHAGYYCCL